MKKLVTLIMLLGVFAMYAEISAQTTTTPPTNHGKNFVDKNGDGYNDNAGKGKKGGKNGKGGFGAAGKGMKNGTQNCTTTGTQTGTQSGSGNGYRGGRK